MLTSQSRQDAFNRLSLESLHILTDLVSTKFEDITGVHEWLDDVIQVAEQSDNTARAIAANTVMLVISKQFGNDKCDVTCLDSQVKDELLTMLELP